MSVITERNHVQRTSMIAHGNIRTRWVLITPALASEWLERNRRNRRFMESLCARYRHDMTRKQWLETHEGIAFDEHDNLIDGQHRLEGIVRSGEPQWMLVTEGLDENVIEVINRGKVRTLAHALQIMGYEHSDNRTIAIARRMMHGPNAAGGSKKALISDTTIRKFIDNNLEAIIFATTNLRRNLGPAPVAAVIGRAYYHADTERLSRFQFAMADSIPKDELQPGDQSARMLKRALDNQIQLGGEAGSVMAYRKAQNALSAYLNRNDLGKLYELEDDRFPLPADKQLQLDREEKAA